MRLEWNPFDSIEALADKIRQGQISAEEATGRYLKRIENLNPRFNALLSVSRHAPEAAAAIQRQLDRGGTVGPLAGIPVAVKDLILTADLPTTAGSRVFGKGLASERDAALVNRLKRAGAVIIGKAHLHEFGYGVTNENAHFGPALNPWHPEKISGGSSGGSAIAVATAMCPGSIGTDTRGSIRIPAAFCGACGLKPTRGAVPLEGVIPLSWTLDHVGPMARRVKDVAILFQALRGARQDFPRAARPAQKVTGYRLGFCDYFWRQLDREIENPLRTALQMFKDRGFEVREIKIPGIDEALEASRIMAATDALAYHRRHLKERSQNYDPAVLQRLLQGEKIAGVEVAEAFQLRRGLVASFRQAFREVDCLVGAAVPCLPPAVGAGEVEINGEPAPTVEHLVRLNSPQNVAGVPALVLPCGFSSGDMPVAMQLIAGYGRESVLFEIGNWYQGQTDWHLKRPTGLLGLPE